MQPAHHKRNPGQGPTWLRNLVFIGLCLCGLVALAAYLLPKNQIDDPQTFDKNRRAKGDFGTVVDEVNSEFAQHWQASQVTAAPRADDLTIARRLSLGLTGTVPSLEEIRAFEAQPQSQRLEWWTSHLLEDRRSADYLAERFARAFVGTENGPFLVYRRRRFVTWLSDHLQKNSPYDQVVRDLIADTGLWTSSPGVNFLTVTSNPASGNQPDPIRLAGRTTRAFLAIRIDCVQCHDDMLGNIALGTPDDPRDATQQDFHGLAAFFAQARSGPTGVKDDKKRGYEYVFLDEDEPEPVTAAVPFLPELHHQRGTLREQLARWVTHKNNQAFARATVNRVWALMFGRPLVEPIDSIPLHEEFAPNGRYPPALETLAADFIRHGFSLQRLIRVIAATDVFQRDSRAAFEVTRKHEDAWSVFPLTRLRPEQVSGSLIQSTSLTTIDANTNIIWQLARYFQENEFVRRYGDTGEDEFVDRGGTIPQRQIMMNGRLLAEQTRANPGLINASAAIAVMSADDKTAIESVFLTVLTRRPSPNETERFSQRLADNRRGERMRSVEDIYWVLLNSTEFSWNH